ncbi:hypothetical protein PT015_00770 [Candidatus Mycobacterium wuenschmannii]|uniref:Uncharacterized protein n=1 Tax=Candidatus Mycobacterium wuenschmannii TaxID=3027808 RepID=A0ABY8VWS9_9MYCO|nr:hypothetical protein [Candidatus Mycobacterium wuenschmannii]WIM88098.1 hypothetical protein PT015_00770 [Candidatus Mycobacterium wuenschmannii]
MIEHLLEPSLLQVTASVADLRVQSPHVLKKLCGPFGDRRQHHHQFKDSCPPFRIGCPVRDLAQQLVNISISRIDEIGWIHPHNIGAATDIRLTQRAP